MDKITNELYKSGKKPFNSEVIFSEDYQPLAILYYNLRQIFEYIKVSYSNSAFYIYCDWHFHDGIISPSKKISIEDIDGMFLDCETLYNNRIGEYHVYRSIYPENYDFLFRYIVFDEDEEKDYPGKWGLFDFSSDRDKILNFMENLQINNGNNFKMGKAIDFFTVNSVILNKKIIKS